MRGCVNTFDPEKMRSEVAGIETEMGRTGFWDERERAEELVSRLKELKSKIEPLRSVEHDIKQLRELAAMAGITAALCAYSAAVTKGVEVRAGAAVTVDFELACAVEPKDTKPKATMDIYGFAMLDMGYQSGSNHPDWFDVLRPTRLPAYEGEYGEDGHFFAGVRQSRLGVKGFIPTDVGEIKTIFEFELFGTGVDAGQTTFRLRHAWGELGQFGAGQTWSPFMDPDVFPNSVEYWGPAGMAFFRNVQVRWMPIKGEKNLTLALERPGASGDAGVLADRIELQNIKGRTPLPDFSRWGPLDVQALTTVAAFGEQATYGSPMPNTPFMGALWDPVAQALTAIWNGTQSCHAS